MENKDVIVVGGGFAGVTAARELAHRGHRPLILEARDRLGGRTWTSDFAGRQVELGGTWVHWSQPHVTAEISRYGLPLTQSPEIEDWAWLVDGELRTGETEELWPKMEEALAAFWHEPYERLPDPGQPGWPAQIRELDKLTVADRLATGGFAPEQRDLLSSLWSTCGCGPCAETGLTAMLRWWSLSGRTLRGMFEALGTYKLRDGTRALAEAIVAGDVRLSTPVASIEQNGSGVVVTTRAGERLRAAAVVVTVPLNALGAIDFTPGLSPAKRRAIAEGHSARGAKILLRVRGLTRPALAWAPDSHPISSLQTDVVQGGGDEQIIVAFASDATRLGDPGEAVRALLPAAEVIETRMHDWAGDEFAGGTWSVLRPNHLSELLADLKRPEGAVFLAGDATAGLWNGFIDGAIESGLRAARQIDEN